MKVQPGQPNMTKKVFILQRVMIAILILSIIAKDSEDQAWTIVLESLVFLAMILVEGAKPYYPLYIMAILGEFINVRALQLAILTCLATYLLKYNFYKIQIFDKGNYEAGFKLCKIDGQELAVYYPTNQKGKPAAWIQTDKWSKDLYDLAYIDPLKKRWIPFSLFKFFITYMGKYEIPVNLDVRLCKVNPEQSSYPVIILSHGLSSNMTTHSSYCCWLASQGFIVISMQHNHDLIRFVYDKELLKRKKMFEKIMYETKNHDLQIRSEEMEILYNNLVQGNIMKQIFPQQNDISIKSIRLLGHSFGGATCLETLTNLIAKKTDISLIKGVICIDPWVFPLSESTLEASLGIDITVINSQTFLERFPPEFEMKQKLLRIYENNKSKFKAFVLMGSDHVFSTDFVFVCGNGVTKITKCLNYSESHTYLSLLQNLTRLSIQNGDQRSILEQCWNFIEKNKVKKHNVQVRKEWRHEQIARQK